MMDQDESNKLTGKIIGAAIEVHRHLGPGLLESTYETCLEYELGQTDLMVERQKPLPVVYKGIHIDLGYRIDLLVNEHIILELKAVEQLMPVHRAQILTYLKHGGMPIGLLFNFNVPLLKEGGIHRFVM